MKNKKINRVFIFEPCLGKVTGHWSNICKNFSDELSKRNIEVTLFCQEDPLPEIVQDLNVTPIFSHSSFADTHTEELFNKETSGFLADFSKIDRNMFKKGDLLLFTTVMPHSHKAAMQWLEGLVGNNGPTAAFIFMISAGSVRTVGRKRRLLFELSRFTFLQPFVMKKLLKWEASFYQQQYQSFTADFSKKTEANGYYYFGCCEEFTINFKSIFNTKVRTLPFPTEVSRPNEKNRNKHSTLRIGYFGHASLEKGAQFLSKIIKNTLEKFPDVEFVLHINPNIHTEEILKEFNDLMPNVTCYYGHLDSAKLTELIRSVDINLLPYCPKKYAGMPSMGFTEAMCAGNVVVTPQYTWLSREATKHKTGNVSFKHHTEESITEALLTAIKYYPKLNAKTKKGSKRFLKLNNVKTYMDKILKAVN